MTKISEKLYAVMDCNGRLLELGLTLEQAAREILNHDDKTFEIVHEDGSLRLYASRHSRASSYYRGNTPTKIFGSSEDEIWQKVLDQSWCWDGEPKGQAVPDYIRDLEQMLGSCDPKHRAELIALLDKARNALGGL